MPHCTLEYSANCVDALNFSDVFADLHRQLAAIEAFDVTGVKSRAVAHSDYYIGDVDPARAFVHLRFVLLTGRDISVRQRIVQTCMKLLRTHFAATIAQKDCQLSVEVNEVERSSYAKGDGT